MSGSDADRAGQMRRWPSIVALTAMWIALWGTLSPANVIGGVVVALAVLTLAHRVQPRPVRHFRIVPALRYLAAFARLLVVANYQVIVAVLWPGRIAPGIIAMPLQETTDAVVTLIANSITLTPGTLTLETERRGDTAVLYVHVLDLTNAQGVRDDIRLLERLAADAFGGPGRGDRAGTATRVGLDRAGTIDRDRPDDRRGDDTGRQT